MKNITLKTLKKEIKRQYRQIQKADIKREARVGKPVSLLLQKMGCHERQFNFLGFVEKRGLTREVESYFSWGNGWNWVTGNESLKELIEELK